MQLKSLGNLETAKDIISVTPNNFNVVSDAVKNLGKEMKVTALTTSTLSDTQKIQILMNQGYTAEAAKSAISTASLSDSQTTATFSTTTLSTAFKGLLVKLKSAALAMKDFLLTTPLGWGLMIAGAYCADG